MRDRAFRGRRERLAAAVVGVSACGGGGHPSSSAASSAITELEDTNLRKQCGSAEKTPADAVAGTGRQLP